MSSIPTSFNPSDYQFLLKSVTQGNFVTKAESLKRFNTLVVTDKKQFTIYAKRVVLAIQDLLLEPKEDVNLLACTLTLEVINLNPRDIEYYIRTKLLKNMVKNLGDLKPQIRKTSHYCLLAYVKTYKSFDEIIHIYLSMGVNSSESQLRQKSINSFQSILIMEMKYLNWSAPEFRKMFETLLHKLNDENPYVQKAAEQCILSLSRMEEVRAFSKKLSPPNFTTYRTFCETQKEIGNLNEIKLDIESKNPITPHRNNMNQSQTPRTLSNAGQSLLNLQKLKAKDVSPNKQQSIISRIEEYRKHYQTPHLDEERKVLKKADSVGTVTHREVIPPIRREDKEESRDLKKEDKKPPRESRLVSILPNSPAHHPVIQAMKPEKVENIMGKKLLDDLKNDRDWKVRLEAIEELENKFQAYKDVIDLESMTKTFLPILIKLLADSNFKVALISLKMIEAILLMPMIPMEAVVPQVVEKLADNKIALRQNISKLIKNEYTRSKHQIWIDSLLLQLKRNSNSNIKQEILNIFSRLYEDQTIDYSFEKVIEAVCPLMDDLKTKIKIKTLDLLVSIAVKTMKIDKIKAILMSKMNQVYYEMFLEKMNKELKNHRMDNTDISDNHSEKEKGRTLVLSNRRYTKNLGNSTSTSLQRPPPNQEHNSTRRTASFLEKNPEQVQRKDSNVQDSQDLDSPSKVALKNPDSFNSTDSKRKGPAKSFRKRNQKSFDYKATNYPNGETLLPFTQPEKELKHIIIQLRSEDWQIAFESLQKLRRIIEHHAELLVHSTIKVVVPEIMRLVESLRSSLGKKAVITLNEISNKLKRNLDTELDLIFNKLIKKTLDANSFISEEVKKALTSVCSNCNEGRVLSLLTMSHTSKSIPIKQAIISILECVTFLPNFYDRELQKIVTILVSFMGEGSLQIREKTKMLLNNLINSERSAFVHKLIPPEHLAKLKKKDLVRASQIKLPGEQVPSEAAEPKKTTEELLNLPKRKKKEKILQFPSQFTELEGWLEKCESSDWKVRSQSMTKIFHLCEKYPDESPQHRLSNKIIDVMSKQISDPNVKVATNALHIFKQLVQSIPTMVEVNLSIVLNEIFNCFASQRHEIRDESFVLIDRIINNVEKWMLLQHMCNGCLYAVQKSRAMILGKVQQIAADVYRVKPTIFQKNMYPMINKVADEGRPQLAHPLKELLVTCYEQAGQQMVNFLKPKAKQLLFD